MERLYSPGDRDKLLSLLRQVRTEAGLTQEQVAKTLGRPQSFIAKYELGERRLDVLELRRVCEALGVTLPDFISRLEEQLSRPASSS
jgi:transcriptional regulator with XRE-family HTH domain